MNINEILKEKGLTKYKLSKLSGVPYATLNDICNGTARIEKCSVDTLYRLSKVLNVTIEDLIDDVMKEIQLLEKEISFEIFKSNVCHRVKDNGDLAFIVDTLKSNDIRTYYRLKQYSKSFYLLAMVDYLSRENDLPLYTAYDDIRKQKLSEPLYPDSIIALAEATGDETIKTMSLEEAIPEFRNFNIVENEVRDVV